MEEEPLRDPRWEMLVVTTPLAMPDRLLPIEAKQEQEQINEMNGCRGTKLMRGVNHAKGTNQQGERVC